MSLLKAEQILNAINTKLQVLAPGTVATVSRNNPYPNNNASLPALQILMGADSPYGPEPNNLTYQDWKLEVAVDIILKSSTTPLETELNALRLAVHKAIMADYTLGLSFVFNTYPNVVEAPTQLSEGEEPVAVLRTTFDVSYRASITDPSA